MNDNFSEGNRNIYIILFFILFGIGLRLIWVNDMEWKWDERLMYIAAVKIANTGELPATGMKSGGGIENPGLSMWVFGLIAKFTNSPVTMVRIIIVTNILAIIGFLLLALKKFKGYDREIWLWGIALAAVNPMAVLFSRKLWAQDLLPLLTFLLILGHQFRNRSIGAFLWGLFGALLGQVHMSGFFMSFGLLIFTIWYDFKNSLNFKWKWWIAGSIIGAMGLIPWLNYVFNNAGESKLSLLHIFQFNFYLYWFIDPLGLNLTYSLRDSVFDFFKFPWINGVNTYLTAGLHILLIMISFFIIKEIIRYVRKLKDIIIQMQLSARVSFLNSSHNFYLFAVLIGLGIIMTLSGIWIHPHYLIVAFPLPYIFVIKMLYPYKKIMIATIFIQLMLTISFLGYIHSNQGTFKSDYGKTYTYKIKHNEFLPSQNQHK